MAEPHLKPRQYYIDLYDRHTVEQCRRTEASFDDPDRPLPKTKKVSKEDVERTRTMAKMLYLHMEIGERYLNKEKTIQEWMERDRQRDELYESAEPPEGIRCLTCRNRVTVTHKQLWSESDKEDRVLFMFECPNGCLPRRAFFSDGEEWRIKTPLCLRCNTPLEGKSEDTGKKLVTTRTCPKCGYTETDEYEWTRKQEEELDENFARDRERFCLTDEEGRKYQDEKYRLQELGKLVDKMKEEEERRAGRLKANQKGFHLDGKGYTCAICGVGTPEGDNWYDKWGIKCLVCQKAIDEGEIPASLAKDKESWYTKYELERAFNLTAPIIRKWVKEGILKARTLSYYGKGTHYELFLIEDNKDFLPPKELVKSEMVKERRDGQDYHAMHPWYHFVDPFEHLKGYKIMDHMCVVPPEEMAAREEEKKRKWEEKQARREMLKSRHGGAKGKRKGHRVRPHERGDAGVRKDRENDHEPRATDS